MGTIFRNIGDWQVTYLLKIHGGIAIQPLVLRGHLAGTILKLPRRISKNRFELRATKGC